VTPTTNSLPADDEADVWGIYCDAIRPLPDLMPSEFAEKYRRLHQIYCSERPGAWDNTIFPYQPLVMDCVKEAIDTGKRGVVMMKAGQIGGTDTAINMLMWLKTYKPGPVLFMTATDKVASEFGRERFALVIKDMPLLQLRYIPNPHGDILVKRFTDGKIQLTGGQSVFNLQSTPYRFVGIDELDSLVDNLGGEGDPVKLAEVRMDSYSGQTLMIAYAHPTTKARGAAKIFYEQSDQRRLMVKHECGHEFWLQWEHVKCTPASETQSKADAEQDADCYAYYCPGCGAVISDAERVAMVRHMTLKSVLPPEVAARKTWIGVHASQLYTPSKTIRSFAQRWIECANDENAKRVFYNKILGEPYEPKISRMDIEALRALIVVKRRANDPSFYIRGQVPAGVRFLTAGQDSRTTELHYSVWGWGLRRDVSNNVNLCGWLIDYGCIARPYSLTFSDSEFHVFDGLIYDRRFQATYGDRSFHVVQCGHDVGYVPTQLPIVRYCRTRPRRAIPIKGASETASSLSKSPYARWGAAIRHKAGETDIADESSRMLLLNTYLLKTDFYGWCGTGQRIELPDIVNGQHVGTLKVPRIILPEDVGDDWLTQTKNEELTTGERKGELVWKKCGPNHFADTNTYAYGIAMNLDPFQGGQSDDEHENQQASQRPRRERELVAAGDPAMG